MRNLLIIPLVVALFAAGMWGMVHLLGWPQRPRELGVTAVLCAVSAELALIPAMLAKRSGSVAVAQASLGGTVIQLFLTLVLAAVVWASHVVPMDRQSFVYLLLAFYWISLIGLVIALVRITRKTAASYLQPAAAAKV